MKKFVILLVFIVSISLAQTTVRLAGFDGDANSMAALLDRSG